MPLCRKILALGGGGYDLYRTSRCWTLAWSFLKSRGACGQFAGLVGGMMFGPEKEVGSSTITPFSPRERSKRKLSRKREGFVSTSKKRSFRFTGFRPLQAWPQAKNTKPDVEYRTRNFE